MPRITPVAVFDWYDGVVTALISIDDEPETVRLCSIIAWSPRMNRRAYGAVSVTTDEAAKVTAEKADWGQLVSHSRALIATKTNAILIVVDERSLEVISRRSLAISEFLKVATFEIENAMDATVQGYLVS